MSDKSVDRYRGLLLPDVRLSADSIWAAQSTYTEEGPLPDTPSTSASHMSLNSSGEVYSAQESEVLTIRTERSGMPGASGSGGFVWRNEGDTLYRGWDGPSIITHWEDVAWTDGGASYLNSEIVNPHAITLPDETVLVAHERVAQSGTTRDVQVKSRHRSTGAWSVLATPYTGTTTGDTLYPCLCLLPSGRVLLFHWVEDTTNNLGNVRMHYSDDNGDNWTVGARAALAVSVDTSGSDGAGADGYELGRLRAIYAGGNVCLVSDLTQHNTTPDTQDVIQQWASSDLGASFVAVGDAWDGTARVSVAVTTQGGGKFCDLLEVNGGIVLTFINPVANLFKPLIPTVRKVSNAFEPFGSVLDIEVLTAQDDDYFATASSGTITAGDLTSWKDSTGVLYILGRVASSDVAALNEGQIIESRDGGDTWTPLGKSGLADERGKVWDFGTVTTCPTNFTATRQGGRTVVLHNWAANPGNEDNSLGAMYLGGYSTVTMPFHTTQRIAENQTTWDKTWLPFDLPGGLATWTKTGSGSEALTDGALVLAASSPSSTSVAYEVNPTGTNTEGMVCRFSVLVSAGGSLTANRIGVRLRVANGSADYDVSLRFVSGQFRVYDENGSATIATITTTSYTSGTEVLVAFNKDRLMVWSRHRGSDTDREWTEDVNSTSITNNAVGPESNNLIKWGRPAADATAACSWFEFHHSSDEWTGLSGEKLVDDLDNPEDLSARDISTTDPGFVEGGIKVQAIDGPAFSGEEHSVAVHHDFSLARCLPGGNESPSPRIRWRSQDETEHTIALYLSPSALAATEDSYDLNSIIGVGLFGVNFKEALLQGYDTGSTSWVTLITLDASEGMGPLAWERRGNTVRPSLNNPTASPTPYLDADEFAEGGTFNFGSSARKIQAHSEGSWSIDDDTKRLTRLILEDVDGTEGTSGTSGEIWAPNMVGTFCKQDSQFSAYRLKITASQGTADGYYEIGSVVIGPVFVFADDYSWGRSIETETNVEISEGRDWTRRSRAWSPARRIVEFGWADGVDEYAYSSQNTDPDPDYIKTSTTSNTLPVGSKGETPRQVEGYIRQMQGAHTPLVYLARIEKSEDPSTDAQVYTRRRDFLLGRISGNIRKDSVMGDESIDEVIRVSKISITEEV